MAPRTGRPKLPDDEKRVPVTAMVDPETLKLLDGWAAEHECSRGRAIDAAARRLAGKRAQP